MSDSKSSHAFPISYPNVGYGMTLRDYFAAKAMQALIEKCLRYDRAGNIGLHDAEAKRVVASTAKASYQISDAMLQERSAATQKGNE